MLDKELIKIQGGHCSGKATMCIMMRRETAEQVGARPLFCGCLLLLSFVCLALTLALTILYRLGQINGVFVCYGEINICCPNKSMNKPEIDLCYVTLAE